MVINGPLAPIIEILWYFNSFATNRTLHTPSLATAPAILSRSNHMRAETSVAHILNAGARQIYRRLQTISTFCAERFVADTALFLGFGWGWSFCLCLELSDGLEHLVAFFGNWFVRKHFFSDLFGD